MCLVDESFFYVVGTLVAGSCNALFFFCAGFLYYVKKPRYVLNLMKKAKSLLLPYLLWNSFWIIVATFTQRANLPLSGIWRSTLDFSPSEVASWFLCFRDGYPFQGALWFLPCLFVVNVFAPAADWIMKRLPRSSLLALLALWLLFTQRVAFVSTYCVFFYLARYAALRRPKCGYNFSSFERHPYTATAAVALVAIAFAVLTHFICQPTFALPALTLQRVSVLLNSALMASVVYRLLSSGWRCPVLEWLTGLSFFTYTFHEPFAVAGRRIIAALVESSFAYIPLYLLAWSAVMLLSVCSGAAVKQWLPKLYKTITGGR